MLLLLANLFILLVAYYVLKTVREPLILASGGAELKSYAAAFQAAALVLFVPVYSWLGSRLDRVAAHRRGRTVLRASPWSSSTCGSLVRVPHLGFAFFVWVGIFSVASIALFWSYANDLYGPETGERLFPVIAIGAALGSPVGSTVAGAALHERRPAVPDAARRRPPCSLVHLGLYQADRTAGAAAPARAGAARSPRPRPRRASAWSCAAPTCGDRGAARAPERRQHDRGVHPQPIGRERGVSSPPLPTPPSTSPRTSGRSTAAISSG